MEFTRTFKTIWWFSLFLVLGVFLYDRYPSLVNAKAQWFDGIIFIVWIALALGPLFNQIEIFGLKLSRDIENLKNHVSGELESLRAEIRIKTENNQTINPQFMFGYPPPPDSQLHNLETRIKQEVEKTVVNSGSSQNNDKELYDVFTDPKSENVNVLFRARFTIEKEIRLICELSNLVEAGRPVTVHKMIGMLTENGIISSGIANAIKEVYSVCTPAIHGIEASEEQVDFVRNTAPELISALKSISTRLNWE